MPARHIWELERVFFRDSQRKHKRSYFLTNQVTVVSPFTAENFNPRHVLITVQKEDYYIEVKSKYNWLPFINIFISSITNHYSEMESLSFTWFLVFMAVTTTKAKNESTQDSLLKLPYTSVTETQGKQNVKC